FVRKFALLYNAIQQRFDFDKLARLGEIIERTVAQRGDSGFERRLAGKDDTLGVRGKLFALSDDTNAIEARHIEIDNDAIVSVALQSSDGGEAIGANRGFVAHAVELDTHQLLQ